MRGGGTARFVLCPSARESPELTNSWQQESPDQGGEEAPGHPSSGSGDGEGTNCRLSVCRVMDSVPGTLQSHSENQKEKVKERWLFLFTDEDAETQTQTAGEETSSTLSLPGCVTAEQQQLSPNSLTH